MYQVQSLDFLMPSLRTYASSASFVLGSVGASMNVGVSSIPPSSVPPSGTTSPSQGFSHGLGSIPPPTTPQSSGNPIGGVDAFWGSQYQGGHNPLFSVSYLRSSNTPWIMKTVGVIKLAWCNTIPSNNTTPWNSVASTGPSMPRNSFYQPRAPSTRYQMYGSMHPGLMKGYFGNLVCLFQTKSPFLETLNFTYLTHLTNDPINHQDGWLVVLTKNPSDIPKFEKAPQHIS